MFCKYTPAVLKKELRQAILFGPSRPSQREGHQLTALAYIEFLFLSTSSNKLVLCVAKSPPWGYLAGLYIIVDFLNSIFSFFIDPGIFPLT